MALHGWDVVPADLAMPATGTDTSAPTTIPKNAIALAVHTPTSLGGATLKLQSLDHAADTATEVWRDVQVFNLADGTFVALDGIPENKVTTLPITATGGGNIRFVASADQSSGPTTIKLDFLCV